jgi:hypothetical protein
MVEMAVILGPDEELRRNSGLKSPRKAHAIIAGMPDAPPPPLRPISALKVPPPAEDKVLCERCGAGEMYRMHAVWRCPACGYKTDCCGW